MRWLQKQIKKIIDENSRYKDQIDKIKNIQKDVFNEFKEKTILKLIFLHYAMAIYTTIIARWYKNMYYIDLFAGSGINKTKNSKDIIIGSPFIATLNHATKYNLFYFVESDEKYAKALDARLDALSINNKKVLNEDCNKAIDNILIQINKINKKHTLFFIDPHAMEIDWETMRKCLELKSDIIFTFMTCQIKRAWGSSVSRFSYKQRKLRSFFGDDSWKRAKDADDLLKIYKENILKIRKDGIIEDVNINLGEKFSYNVFFITNKTQGENPWIKGIQEAKKEIEQNSEDAVRISLDIIKNRQKELSSFIKK